MIEIRWHARGGQGAWTASNLLAAAAVKEGKFVQSFPTFGPERMGAPVAAFTRISEEAIELHCMIYEPDVVIVMDPTVIKTVNVTEGLKEGGILLVNWEGGELKEMLGEVGGKEVYFLPATRIAREYIGRPVTGTAMIGGLLGIKPLIKLESIKKALYERFSPPLAEKNVRVVEEGMSSVRRLR